MYKNILIVKPSSLGDVVHTLPLLKDLRMGFPDAHIAWLIKRQYAGILEGNPYLNEIIPWEWDGFGLIKKLRESRFDLIIDVQGLFRSGFMTFLSGAPERIGFKNARELSPLFYTKRIAVPTIPNEDTLRRSSSGSRSDSTRAALFGMALHAVDRYRLITDYLGIKQYPPDFTIIIDAQEKGYVEKLLFESGVKGGDVLVMVNPSARWQSKRWGTERFANLCDVLSSEYGVKTVIIGGPEDINITCEIKTLMKTVPIITAGKTTIKGLVALLSKAKVLVTNDSGPMHIAAALNVPVVAIFGPTDPKRTGPYGKEHIVVRKDMPCSPCFKKCCGDLLCMEDVSVEDVKVAIREVLNDASEG